MPPPVELAADPCAGFPFISLERVTHSNLGGLGPDKGDEGIVFSAKDYVPGSYTEDLVITLNASAKYKAGHVSDNGIHGKYGQISMEGGTEAEFTFRIIDPATKKPKKVKKQEFTFLDLDQSAGVTNREYIKVRDVAQVWLTKNTEILVSEVDGTKQYTSSVEGDGHDNPRDPLALTVQQKNRAVTMEFRDFSELKVTLGSTPGPHVRDFFFVARPTLLCAQTVGYANDGEDEVMAVEHTDSASSSDGKTGSEEECAYKVPKLKYCIPKMLKMPRIPSMPKIPEAWEFWRS